MYLFDRQVESSLPALGDHETTTFQDLSTKGKMSAFRSDQSWVSVDKLADLEVIEDRINSSDTMFDMA